MSEHNDTPRTEREATCGMHLALSRKDNGALSGFDRFCESFTCADCGPYRRKKTLRKLRLYFERAETLYAYRTSDEAWTKRVKRRLSPRKGVPKPWWWGYATLLLINRTASSSVLRIQVQTPVCSRTRGR